MRADKDLHQPASESPQTDESYRGGGDVISKGGGDVISKETTPPASEPDNEAQDSASIRTPNP